MSDGFKGKLAKLAGARMRPEPSAVRIRVEETFDEIAAAKGRNVTWQQIADLLNEEGLHATDGSLLTANQVSAAYSSEKAARGERRRRPRKQLVQTTAPAVQPPPPTGLAEPGDEPEPTRRGFQFTKSRPKIHRKEWP